MRRARWLWLSALVLGVCVAAPLTARAQSFHCAAAPRIAAGCAPCGVGGFNTGCYNPCYTPCYNSVFNCRPNCYPVGYYPNFLYVSPYYYGYGTYTGGFYGGNFYPGIVPPQPVPTVILTQNVSGSRICRFTVRVPEYAQLYFDGMQLADTGSTRTFRTPELAGGTKFNYTVAAQWIENGQQVRMEQKIHFHPGDRLVVDFSNPTSLASQPVASSQP
ncbi:MAG: TIGR03000 domain-containing protein [Gemmataceae bacterium]